MASKAQVSAEFLLFIGLAFVIAIAFAYASLGQLKDISLQKENDAIRDLGMKLQKEVFIAANVEDGYIRIFSIPDKLGSMNYSLNVQNSTLTVQSGSSVFIAAVSNIAGNFTKGTNIINKTGGIIRVN